MLLSSFACEDALTGPEFSSELNVGSVVLWAEFDPGSNPPPTPNHAVFVVTVFVRSIVAEEIFAPYRVDEFRFYREGELVLSLMPDAVGPKQGGLTLPPGGESSIISFGAFADVFHDAGLDPGTYLGTAAMGTLSGESLGELLIGEFNLPPDNRPIE